MKLSKKKLILFMNLEKKKEEKKEIFIKNQILMNQHMPIV